LWAAAGIADAAGGTVDTAQWYLEETQEITPLLARVADWLV
jgi:hypothetical protein